MSTIRKVVTSCYALLLCATAWAGDVTLAWDASASEGVLGYYLYIGNASRVYEQNIDVGNYLTYQITGLTEGRWFFSLKAYGTDNRQSEFSNEVFVIVNADGTVLRLTPPILQGGTI